MVHFVGAGCGAADLITVRGARLLSEADVVIYAGSLVNPELLKGTKEGCEIHDSARMTLPEVLGVMERAEAEKKTIVRLHTGDPSLYGAIREQMDRLEEIVKKLESGDGSLDQALALFEEGSKLAGACTAMLDQAEQKVTKLLSLESSAEAPFDADTSQGTN